MFELREYMKFSDIRESKFNTVCEYESVFSSFNMIKLQITICISYYIMIMVRLVLVTSKFI